MNARDRYLCLKTKVDRDVASGWNGKQRRRTEKELEHYLKLKKNKLRVKRIRQFANVLANETGEVGVISLLNQAGNAMCYGGAKDDISFVIWERKVSKMPLSEIEAMLLGESL